LAQLAVTIEELQAAKRRDMGLPDQFEGDDEDEDVALDEKPLQLAILGRQNVGKVSAHSDSLSTLTILQIPLTSTPAKYCS
jgi:predicted GTPase